MRRGLSRIELALSLAAPLGVLALAATLGGWGAILFLVAVLGGLGVAASAFGVDSRDGRDW